MTTQQFEELIVLLNKINENVKLITASKTGEGLYGLSDVYSEITSTISAVGDVESAVKEVKEAVKNIDLGR